MAREILLYASDEKAAASSVENSGGRLLHVFTPRVFVADLPPDIDTRHLSGISTVAPDDLDDPGRLFSEAWHRQLAERSSAMETLKWNTPGFLPPDLPRTAAPSREESVPTSLYLTGKVVIGIVVVSGSDWTPIYGGLSCISVGQDGTVWGVNNKSVILRWTGAQWQRQSRRADLGWRRRQGLAPR